VLITVLLVLGAVSAQEVSTEVLSSEDELLDALINGEIDYDVYLTLIDLLLNGVDSTQLFMFDFIPGAPAPRSSSQRSVLEREQLRAFVGGGQRSGKGRGSVGYRYGQELEEDGRGRYRAASRYAITPRVEGVLNLGREYSGRERVLTRSLSFRFDSSGVVRKLTLGSFRERFGLGTAIGYRGKLLDFSSQLNGESWLFPDWGGFNGLRIESARSRFSSTVMASFNRDFSHSLTTIAASGKLGFGTVTPTGILAVHRLANRGSGRHVSIYHAAVNLIGDYDHGSYAVEICGQTGLQKAASAVVEADLDWGRTEIMFSGWSYGRGFLDLASGSRAASLSQTQEIGPVDFRFSSKRAGQLGTLVKARYHAGAMTTLLFDGILAARGSDTATTQCLVVAERQISDRHAVRCDFMYKSNVRAGSPEKLRRRGRVEWQWQRPDCRVRSALGFTNETSSGEYWSLLVSVTRTVGQDDRWQIWSNWRRMTHGRIDYWYGYISFMQPFHERISGGVKFADAYSRASVNHHAPALTLELAVLL
jgi:hypothetical protein